MTNISQKHVCLYQWHLLIKCNENNNGNIEHINKKYMDQDLDVEESLENIDCLGKTKSLF